MHWKLAGDTELHQYFEAENVYSKKWHQIVGQVAVVRDITNNFDWQLTVWEAEFNGKVKRFAADEARQNSFVFAIPL